MNLKFAKVSAAALATVFGVVVASVAVAQDKYPSRPIEFILPAPPGGGLDRTMRLLAEFAEPILGQKILFTYKPGGNGTIGTSLIAQAKPDGYTIGAVWHSPLTTAPHTLQVPYTLDDFIPVVQFSAGPYVICVAPDFPANTGQELIAELKANPQKYIYGHDGVGGTVHLASERTLKPLGVQLRGVPFNGSGETARAFLGGHIAVYSGSVPPIGPHMAAGKAKCLIIHSKQRNPMLPQAASLTDLGVPDSETLLWHAIIAPKGVPPDRIAVVERAFREAASQTKYLEFLRGNGETAPLKTGADLAKIWNDESVAMGTLVQTMGIKKQ